MDLRQRWVKSFFTLQKLRSLEFNRAVMPKNTSSQKLNLIVPGNTAEEHVKITIVREGVLTTVSKLRLLKDAEKDSDEGSVHKLPSEVLTKGHTVLVAGERKDKIAEERKVSFSMFPVKLSNLRKSFAGKYYALMTGGLENSELLSVFKERNLSLLNPVLDRYSLLSSTIAEHTHNGVMKHKGF